MGRGSAILTLLHMRYTTGALRHSRLHSAQCTLHILSHAMPQHTPDHTCRLHCVHTIQYEAQVLCTLCGTQVTLYETTS